MNEPAQIRKKNRRHSDVFKAQVLAQCLVRGTSVRQVARANGLGDSLVHSWLIKDKAKSRGVILKRASPEFVQLPVSASPTSAVSPIHIEVNKGPLRMSIDWAESAAVSAAVWLREANPTVRFLVQVHSTQ